MAGGNQYIDLDNKKYDDYRASTDNGAIRVGAGNEKLKRVSFSTYVSMIHLQGWETWNVVTAGYGHLHGDGPNNNYTD